MDILAEKEEIIRRFNQIHDIDLIKAIKRLLDFGQNKISDDEVALKASIDRALHESKLGLGRPYDEFMVEMRTKFR